MMISERKELAIIAIDFDGTITRNDAWPGIGDPNYPVIHAIQNAQSRGVRMVLWTNRQDDNTRNPGCLTEALTWCAEHGIIFDGVNENIPELAERFDLWTRKISADYYVDDKSPGSIDWFLQEYGTHTKVAYYPLSMNTPMLVDLPLISVTCRVWQQETDGYQNPIICVQIERRGGLPPYGEVGHLEVTKSGYNYKKYELRDCDIIIGVTESYNRTARVEFTIEEK